MAVKFKIGFTIDAETLFGMISKFLPLENLSVEEVAVRTSPAAPPRLAATKPKPTLKRTRVRSASNHLNEGLNGVILSYLADGKPHRAVEIKDPLKRAGFSPNSVGSALNRLALRKLVFQPEMGLWQLKQQPVAESA